MPDIEVPADVLKEALTQLYRHMELKRIRMPPRFEKISRLWIRDAPYYSEFMIRFNFFETEGVPTFGVNCINGHINLYFNPKYLNGGIDYIKFDMHGKPVVKKDAHGNVEHDANGDVAYETEPWRGLQDTKNGSELEAVLVHEIMHLVLLTQERALDDAELWNIASDMIINDMIRNMTINGRALPLPPGAVYLDDAKSLGYDGPAITERLYYWLINKRASMQKPKLCSKCGGTGKQKCSTCGGTGKNKKKEPCPDCNGSKEEVCDHCHGQGTESDDLFDTIFKSRIDIHDMLADNDNLTESVMQDITQCAAIKGWGHISGSGIDRLKELLKKSKINWRRELRSALSSAVHGYGSSSYDSWMKPNRKGLPLPGRKRLENKIIVCIDTSGSIGNDEIEQFFAEIESIVRDFSKLTILQWDTEIKAVNENYKKGAWKSIEIKGRGGTNVQCVFDWTSEHREEKTTLVILTDGCFGYDFKINREKVVWCVTTRTSKPPHGKIIYIDINE